MKLQDILDFIPGVKDKRLLEESLLSQQYTDRVNQANAGEHRVVTPVNPTKEEQQAFIGISPPSPKQNTLAVIMENLKMGNKTISPIVEKSAPVKISQVKAKVRVIPTVTPTPVPQITPPPDPTAAPYVKIIHESAKRYGIPEKVFYNLLRAESNFNPNAQSPVGAVGIAQFMPSTAEGLGIDPLDPEQAIPAAAKYLSDKVKRHGSLRNALASYNAGSSNVELYGGVPPFPETQNYVKKILGK